MLKPLTLLPALDQAAVATLKKSIQVQSSPPRILLLCGSLHPGSRSHAAVEEAARLLSDFGAEPRIFDASALPLPDRYSHQNSAVLALRALSRWSQGQVWCNAERRGGISSLIKAQIDHLRPHLGDGPSCGRALAVMQVFNDAQPAKAANTLRVLGRKLNMLVVPSELCLNLAAEDLDADGRLKASIAHQQIADLMQRLISLTSSLQLLTDNAPLRTKRTRKAAARSGAGAIEAVSPSAS